MKKNKIAITTGDTKGIGKELVIKALSALCPDKDQIIIIGENTGLDYQTIEIDKSDNGKFCYESLALASSLAKKGEIQGIVTAPVSKEELHKSGYNFNGQTEVLEKLLSRGGQKAEMLFISKDLRVLLLTRHLSLSQIKITKEDVFNKTKILNDFLIQKCKITNPKIAILALNPHAGENGILGREEIDIISPAIQNLNNEKINAFGPFSADGLFAKIGQRYLNNEKQEYDAVIAMYHDQALCPIKALCANSAVNTTIGLDVIRTSPSSGTAYDIAGKNIANPDSMIEAINLILKLI